MEQFGLCMAMSDLPVFLHTLRPCLVTLKPSQHMPSIAKQSFWTHQRLSQQKWTHKVNNLFHFVSRVTRRRWQQPRRSQRKRGRSSRRAKRTWRPSRMTLGRRRTAMRIPRKTAQRKKVSAGHDDGMFLLVSREALAAGQPADVLSNWWVLHVSSLTKHQWRGLSQLWFQH